MKLICNERRCGWRGTEAEMLRADHPLQPGVEILGCPWCRETDTLRGACDEPNCWEEATCGTPTPGGYRSTCGKHMPKVPNAELTGDALARRPG